MSVVLATSSIAGAAPATICSRPHNRLLWSNTSITLMAFCIVMLYLFT